ncbi:MAG: lysophospholipase [Robiginitomaculum sp.]|nr:lysophospholipase [Robiginitomaculum sp.]
MQLLKWILIGAAGVYFAALLFVFFAQRSFMYFPPSGSVPDGFLSEQNVQIIPIEVEGVATLKSIYMPPNESAPVILLMHGNGSAAYQYTAHFEAFRRWGLGYLAVEYPGYAGNPGKPNERDILRTALANYDALIQTGIKPERIFLYGDSLGAAAAIYVASERQAAGLILSAPFLSMQAMARRQMPWFPTSLLLKDKYRSDLKITAVDEPLLVLHGDADTVIPYTQSKALFELHQGDKNYVLIKGGQHNLWNTEIPEHIRAFVETYTRP